MKKIVILALHLGTGGIENAISSIANILCEKYDIKIISTYKIDEKPAFYLNDKIKVEYLLNIKPNKKELIDALKNKKVLKFFKEALKCIKILYLRKSKMIGAIKSLDADIVISTRVLHNKWLGKYGNNKIIKIAQEHNYHNNDAKYINKVIKSLCKIDYFMPTSKELTEFYSEKLENSKIKVKYIQNSLSRFPSNVSNLKSKNLLSVGRLSEEKGYLDLIDIYNNVYQKHKDWKLRIVGDGLQKELLQQKINNLNLEKNVILTGFKNKDELEEISLDSSIYIMTSYTESFGLVLIEAESYGLPLVVFDTAKGANEIIKENINGYFIENRDKLKMAEKINELIENYELRKEIGENGRKLSECFKKEVIANKWYEFIESCYK